MKLTMDNFSKRVCWFRTENTEGVVYTYETKNTIYDVTMKDGVNYYQTNMDGYNNCNVHPIHRAIEKHYSI